MSGVPADVYTHGHAESVLRSHRWRTAENSAAYLLPHLAPDATVLDLGCGPATITADLAGRVPAGRVIGVDRAADVLAGAQPPPANMTLAVGDAYRLDFADDSFDVVHAHQVLQHLSDPVAALREMRRVCRPGGVVAARDTDYGAFAWWPQDPALDRWLDGYRRAARANAAEPDAGRRLKSWALRAGYVDVTTSAGVWCFSDPVERAWWGDLWADRVMTSDLAEQLRSIGLTAGDLDSIAAGWRHWRDSPDGWFLVPHGEILCWV